MSSDPKRVSLRYGLKCYATCECGDHFYVLRPPAPAIAVEWVCAECGRKTIFDWGIALQPENDPRSIRFQVVA